MTKQQHFYTITMTKATLFVRDVVVLSDLPEKWIGFGFGGRTVWPPFSFFPLDYWIEEDRERVDVVTG